jgi:hypothetical protein
MPHISLIRRTPAAATLTILLLAAGGLAACGGSGGSTTNSAKAATNSAATGAAGSGTSPSGTSSTGTTPAAPGSPAGPGSAARTLRFTAMRACLSKKGITVPQRTPGFVPGGGAQLPKGMTRTQFAEALKSCGANVGGPLGGPHRSFHPGAHTFNNPRFHAVLARFAACLRQNGVNVGEPNTTGKGPIFNTKGLNTGSTQFKAASAKCRGVLFAGVRPKAAPGAAASGGVTKG